MITALDIRNFKCFEHLRLPFGELTLLTGFNGGGKSSAIQPLLLLAQGLRSAEVQGTFPLNGPLVRLGTVGDVLPSDVGNGIIEFNIHGKADEASWSFAARAGDRFLHVVSPDENRPVAQQSDNPIRSPNASAGEAGVLQNLIELTYISAVRGGTADSFPIPDEGSGQVGKVGIDGCFAPYRYDDSVDNEVPERRRHPGEPATSVRKQLDAWIATLFPGAQANVQSIPQVSLLSLQFRLSQIGAWRRPANVGYGLTYAFPILVALLLAQDDQVVIIDSPEAHLHPSAQSQMGRILAHFAAGGVQILVETHSDHLLNGARLAVKERALPQSALAIHFFTRASKDGHGVISPRVDIEGRIDEWPDGFFDQSEKDLARLAGWT
jgi:predicted ATPase